jgi:hypothetical protein
MLYKALIVYSLKGCNEIHPRKAQVALKYITTRPLKVITNSTYLRRTME